MESSDGVEELKNGSLNPSIVGDAGEEGEGVDGSRLCLGEGGRDWIAWITNWSISLHTL